MKKWIIRIALGIVLLVVIAVVGVFLSIDAIVRSQVEKTASASTGTSVTLQSASVGVFSGKIGLSGLNVPNPEGYDPGTPFLKLGDCHLAADIGSLTGDVIRVSEISLDKLVLNIEQNGTKSNLQSIMNANQSHSAAANSGQPTGPETKPAKKIAVGKIILTNITATIKASELGQNINIPVNIPLLEIDNPTKPDGSPADIGDIISQVSTKIATQAMQDPRIPEGVRAVMSTATNVMANLKNVNVNNVGGAATQTINNILGGFGQQKKP